MQDTQLEPKVLGQLLLMQSVLINLHEEKSIFSFVCHGLQDIPGIGNVNYYKRDKSNTNILPSQVSFPISMGSSYFGELVVDISDIDRYKPYEDYLKNFAFMIGVILEERNQRQLNMQHSVFLEQRIIERTQELLIEKENLIESQRRFTELMQNIRLLSVMIDVNGDIIFCNNFLLDTTNYSLDEVLNKNWFDLFLPEESAKNTKLVFADAIKGKEFAYHYENEIVTKTGERLLVSWNNTILRDLDKKIIGTASIGENITERKKAEADLVIAKELAEQSDRLKTAFLCNMSHEIRTPMNGILGFAELLKLPDLSGEKQQEYIRIIEKGGARMLNIINDIVDISKIESGQMNISVDETDVNEKLEFVYNLLGIDAKQKGLLLTLKNSLSAKEARINTDSDKLSAVLSNLVKNAIKYTNKGSIEFGCYFMDMLPISQLQFYVKDTGIGIQKSKQNAIFERFIQAEINDKMARQGAGLGLAISKAYVEMLGGKIWVESEEGKGSIFYFTIPCLPISKFNKDKFITDESISPEKSIEKGLKLLIAEDDESSFELISIFVQKFASDIIHVQTGLEAVEVCRKHPDIDLILMDIQLPELDGYRATQQIRQFNKNVVIIAQTAYALSGDKEKALESGCNDYIAKPIKRDNLLELLLKHFSEAKVK